MMHQYKVGDRDYYYGMIECKLGHCSMSMPKKVSIVGKITPKYKSLLRNDAMCRFIEKNITLQNLKDEGIPEQFATEVLKLHFPTQEILESKELDQKTLEALKYIELFSFMKNLAGKRRYFQASVTKKCTYDKWLNTLPFRLTDEQIMAIDDIRADFTKDVAAKRMVVGDVGSGKTMVILASVYMMLPSRSILMAPTTILAKQLYEEAQKFLPDIRSTLVTNKTKKIDLNDFDFIVGTHALLYRELPHADLIMVDEQHRFGTAQRNLLEKLVSQGEKKPHFYNFLQLQYQELKL
jgi:ATP-dependent DNA helicase RecG